MSFDYQLGHSCPHLLIEEPVSLGSDRRSMVPIAPIGNSNLLRVLVNNELYVPPSGLYSQASLKGTMAGPFTIEGCLVVGGASVDNNVLTVTSSTETQTFRLPTGVRVPIDTLLRMFRQTFKDIIVDNDKGHLVFLDVAKIGPESFIRVGGRAATSLGFGGQQQARGKEIYPGWQLIQRTDTLPMVGRNGQVTSHARYPQFLKPLKTSPMVKLTYVAPPERCPRCRGTFIENDWRFNPQGDLITIVNEDLLYQAALKILLTKKGSNPFYPQYGSKLMERIGAKAVGATATLVREDVMVALQAMQSLQTQQAKHQSVALQERLARILSVEVYPHQSDPTAFLVDVVVSNMTGIPVKLSVVFSVPGAVALAGTNNLSLGLAPAGY